MDAAQLLSQADVLADLRISGKRRLLAEMASHAGRRIGIGPDRNLDALLRREELGSTGMGDGIAIPHTRMPDVLSPFGVLVRLRSAIDFESVDGKPVDLVLLLLLPAGAPGCHLNALACVARRLRDPRVAASLRGARGPATLHASFVDQRTNVVIS